MMTTVFIGLILEISAIILTTSYLRGTEIVPDPSQYVIFWLLIWILIVLLSIIIGQNKELSSLKKEN